MSGGAIGTAAGNAVNGAQTGALIPRSMLVQLGIMAGAQVLGVMTQPGVKRPTFEDIQINPADASRVWPYICGTVETTPHLISYFDFNTKKVKNDVGTGEIIAQAGISAAAAAAAVYGATGGPFGAAANAPAIATAAVIGGFTGAITSALGQLRTWSYRQYLGFAYGISHGPLDSVNVVKYDEKQVNAAGVALTGNTAQLLCDFPTAFGGDHEGGGVYWLCDVVRGDFWPDQQPLPYLVAQIGDTVPAFSGKALFVIRGPSGYRESGYFSATGTISGAPVRPLKLQVSRYPNNLGVSEFKNVNDGDASVAECIWEWLTSPAFGVKRLDVSKLDKPSFQNVSEQLHGEGVGVSLEFNSETDCETAIETFCSLSDCALIGSFRTGKLALKHVTRTYSIAQTFTRGYDGANTDRSEYNVISVDGFTPGAWDSTVNDLHYSFADRLNNFQITRRNAPDLANHLQQGRHRPQTMDLQGVATGTQAAYTASRELRAASFPRPPITLTVNRDGDLVEPWDVIRLVDNKNRITKDLLVLDKKPGGVDEARIQLVCVEHVYGVGNSTFTAPPDPEWTDPVGTPDDITQSVVIDAPYFLSGSDSPRILAFAEKPAGNQIAYDLHVSEDGGTTYVQQGTAIDFAIKGTITEAVDRLTDPTLTTLTFTPSRSLDATRLQSASAAQVAGGANLLYWPATGELMAVEGIEETSEDEYTLTTVWRAVLDTTPQPHSAGATVWFFSDWKIVTPTEYADATATRTKFLSRTLNEVQSLSDVSHTSLTVDERGHRPYPVRYVDINGDHTLLEANDATSDTVITWRESNRLVEGQVLAQDATTTDPEDDTTYTVKVYQSSNGVAVGALLHTETGVTGTTWTYTAAAEATDSGGSLNGWLIVDVITDRDGLESRFAWRRPVSRPGAAAGDGLLFESGDFWTTEASEFVVVE